MKLIKIPPDYYYQSLKKNWLQRVYHSHRFALIKKILGRVKGNLLDFGCADGTFTDVLSSQVKGQVWGVDINPDFLAFAKAAYPKINFLLLTAEKLPFPDNFFAAVTCLEVLEHLSKPQETLLELKRVLKTNGILVVLVPTENLLFRALWFFWTKGKGKVWRGTHLVKFKEGKLEELLLKNGFRIIEKRISHLGMLLALKLEKVKKRS